AHGCRIRPMHPSSARPDAAQHRHDCGRETPVAFAILHLRSGTLSERAPLRFGWRKLQLHDRILLCPPAPTLPVLEPVMPSIDIRHPHSKTQKQARTAVTRVADKVQERFAVGCAWNQNTLEFTRSGVNGEIHVLVGEIHVPVNLGFLLSALRGPIESEIRSYLEREFT